MRIVIFTAERFLEQGLPYATLVESLTTSDLLLCRQVLPRTQGDAARMKRRFGSSPDFRDLPRQVWIALRGAVRRAAHDRAKGSQTVPPPGTPPEGFETPDIDSDETLARVRAWKPDLGIALGEPSFQRRVFGIPRLGTLSLQLGGVIHGHRAPPGSWELECGADTIGVTVHLSHGGPDTTGLITGGTVPLYPADTLVRVRDRLSELAQMLLRDAIALVSQGAPAGSMGGGDGPPRRDPTLQRRPRLLAWTGLRRLRATVMNPTYVPKRIAAVAALLVVRPVRDLWRTLRASHPVRVFTFHRVSALCRDPLTVSPAVFRRQIEYLKRSHDIVTLEKALGLLRDRMPLRRPVAALTFDDGYRSVYDHAMPILRDLGTVACCFVCTDMAGTERRYEHDSDNPLRPHLGVMSWEQIAELQLLGWSIGGHTATHARLSECTGDALQYELESPIARIRERLRVQDVAMAFTFGGAADTSPEAEALAQELGYSAYFSNWGGDNRTARNPFFLQRIDIGGDLPTFIWKAWIHGFDFARLRWWGRRARPGTR